MDLESGQFLIEDLGERLRSFHHGTRRERIATAIAAGLSVDPDSTVEGIVRGAVVIADRLIAALDAPKDAAK